MCIGFIYINPSLTHDAFQLVVLNNRDEFYNRPTRPASLWNGHCISGLDLQEGREGGTWLGVSTKGKIAMLVNIMGGSKDKKGRGSLVPDFLQMEGGVDEFVEGVQGCLGHYDPMSLVLLHRQPHNSWKTVIMSNESTNKMVVDEEFIAISNSPYERPFAKVTASKHLFKECIEKFNKVDLKEELVVELLKLLRSTTQHWPDEELSSRQASKALKSHDVLSSNFVVSPVYGTRTHSIILIDSKGKGQYLEVTMAQQEGVDEKLSDLQPGLIKDYITEINKSSSSSPPSAPTASSSSSSLPVSWSPQIIDFQIA